MKTNKVHGDPDLVRRVNEIYHDLQAAEFNEIHKHRHAVESRFWKAEVVPRLASDGAAFGVDLCTGTGFVPRILLQSLPSVKMLCVDLSQQRPGVCQAIPGHGCCPAPPSMPVTYVPSRFQTPRPTGSR